MEIDWLVFLGAVIVFFGIVCMITGDGTEDPQESYRVHKWFQG